MKTFTLIATFALLASACSSSDNTSPADASTTLPGEDGSTTPGTDGSTTTPGTDTDGSTTNPDPDASADLDASTPTDGDAGSEADASPVDAGPPNAKVVGTWKLQSTGPTCGIDLGQKFTAEAQPGSDYNFTLKSIDSPQSPTISCALSVADPTTYTCKSMSINGNITLQCPGTLSIGSLQGVISGSAVELHASVTRTPSGGGGTCAPLKCGPLDHSATGTITPN